MYMKYYNKLIYNIVEGEDYCVFEHICVYIYKIASYC
jgi:hypothetical protein